MYGWRGKVLRVDLAGELVQEESLDPELPKILSAEEVSASSACSRKLTQTAILWDRIMF